MYKRNKKVDLKYIDINLLFICDDLLKCNEDSIFALIKKYCETTGDEINGEKVIVSNTPIEELHIPSEYKITDNGVLTLIDEDYNLATLIYSNMRLMQKGKIKYLDLDKQKEIVNLKKYK